MATKKTICGIHLAITLSCMLVLPAISDADAQSINGKWKQELNDALEKIKSCQSLDGSTEPCSNLVGESLKKVYNVNDFYSPALKRYLRASEIPSYLQENDKWALLGKSFDQSVLEAAQENANAKKAVIAVYQDKTGIGHVVLIVPGALTPSGSWGMKVPNAASFLPADPQKSFVEKGLSFAFTKSMMKDVSLYVRQY